MRPGPNGGGLSRKAIMTEIDDSLRRLGTDHVDIYMIHRLDNETPMEETLEALHDVVKSGKARYLGASSMHAWQFAKAPPPPGAPRLGPVRHHAGPLQPARPRGGTRNAPALRRRGRRHHGVEPPRPRPSRPPLRPGERQRARRHRRRLRRHALHKANADSDRQIIDEVGAIADARGVTRAQVALAWLRRNPVVAAPIVGARTIQQIDDAVASLDLDITDEEARRLEAPYTPRHDFQGISDARELERIKAGIPGYANL